MKITGTTGLFALFGSPVSHSGSPAMYNYSFERLGLDYVYLAFDIPENRVEKAIEAANLFQLKGFNLTMPCKNEAIKYLDEVSEAARIVGAVNTVVREDGKLKGYITDGVGFANHLAAEGVFVAGKKVTIVGSGGAGTAIQVELALRGAKEITILSRRTGFFHRALETAEKISSLSAHTVVRVFDSEDTAIVTREVKDSDIFVNASIIGMKPREDETVLKDSSAFHNNLTVCDVVYNPTETRLLKEAKERGLKTIDGRGMLLYQGVQAFQLFTGKEMPVEEVRSKFFS